MKCPIHHGRLCFVIFPISIWTLFALAEVGGMSSNGCLKAAAKQEAGSESNAVDPPPKPVGLPQQDPANSIPPAIKTVRTAEEYLAELDKSDAEGRWFFEVALPEDEMKKLLAELRTRFPFQSLADRLAAVDRPDRLEVLQRMQPDRFNAEASELPAKEGPGRRVTSNEMRAVALETLHSDSVAKFISEPGFGISRLPRPSPYDLPRKRGQIVLNTDYHSTVEFASDPPIALGAQVVGSDTRMPDQNSVNELHAGVAAQFASKNQNGLVRDRDHIAGFEPHAVDTVWSASLNLNVRDTSPQAKPDAGETVPRWHLNRMELVGMLASDRFRVYVSESLPAMNELAQVETRPLDGFELEGLSQLLADQQLHVAATPNRIRMLGALRAGDSCLECHSVRPGDLLGALSYELIRVPRIPLEPPVNPATGK